MDAVVSETTVPVDVLWIAVGGGVLVDVVVVSDMTMPVEVDCEGAGGGGSTVVVVVV